MNKQSTSTARKNTSSTDPKQGHVFVGRKMRNDAATIRSAHAQLSDALSTMKFLGMLDGDAQRMPFAHLGVEVEFRKHVESLDCKSNAYTLLHAIVENVAICAGDDSIESIHLLTVFGNNK